MLDDRRKKQLLIIGFICAVIGIGFGLYYVFFRSIFAPAPTQTAVRQPETSTERPKLPSSATTTVTIPEQQTPSNQQPGQNLPPEQTAPQPGLIPTETSQIAAGGPTVATVITGAKTPSMIANRVQGGVNAYDSTQGAFVRMDNNGKTTYLTDRRFYNLSDIAWSSNGQEAVIGFGDGTNLYYDFSRNVAVRLPDQIKQPTFNTSGDKIAFKWVDPIDRDRNYVGISKPDGTGIKFVQALGYEADKIKVEWSADEQYVGTFRTGKNANAQEVLFIGQNQENYKSLVVEGLNFDYIYAPVGTKILYSTVSMNGDGNPRIYVADSSQNNLGAGFKTNLATTVDKCAFSPDGLSAYCAAPQSLPAGSGLVPELAGATEDDIYRIDIATGTVSLISRPLIDGHDRTSLSNLSVSADGKTLYCTDVDGRAVSIQLAK